LTPNSAIFAPRSVGVTNRFAAGRSPKAGRLDRREKNGRESMLRLSNAASNAS
jgi:hypothetical protein